MNILSKIISGITIIWLMTLTGFVFFGLKEQVGIRGGTKTGFEIRDTSEQLRLSYNSGDYISFTVNDDGDIDIDGSQSATTTIDNAGFEITNGSNGCYWIMGATTTQKCY